MTTFKRSPYEQLAASFSCQASHTLSASKQRKSRWNSLGKVGLLFGSFNPIHTAHLQMAVEAIQKAGLKEVHLILSPQNPFKNAESLAPFQDRAAMIELALQETDYSKWPISLSYIEKTLGLPNYSYKTLQKLHSNRAIPKHLVDKFRNSQKFVLVIGEDVLSQLPSWKNAAWIAEHFNILVFQRKSIQALTAFQSSYAANPSAKKPFYANSSYSFFHSKILSKHHFLQASGEAVRHLCFQYAKQSKPDAKKKIATKLQNFLCPSVLRYIQRNKLYGK